MKNALLIVTAGTLLCVSCLRDYDKKNRIAFAMTVGADLNLFVMDSDGSNKKQITSGAWIDHNPSWSTDGKRIVVASNRDGNREIFTIDPDGGNIVQLTHTVSPKENYAPTWSPDGKKIAFMSNQNIINPVDSDYEIFIMNADGSGLTQLTINTTNSDEFPSFSPDGTTIAYSSSSTNVDIFTMNIDGSSQVQRSGAGGTKYGASWSPDGSKIIYSSNVSGYYNLWIMNPDGTGQVCLKPSGVSENYGTWSPDGREIIFEKSGLLYRINADGTGETQIGGISGLSQIACFEFKPR